jgi:pimeloyl-ACP methyl ester carboxylesterase
MASIDVNGTSLYYEDTGGSGPVIVFSHALLWNTSLFAHQIAYLKHRYRCIAYDHRGQGRSADGTGQAIDIDTLVDDAAALIEALCPGPVHFCGLSLGGIVGMRLAISRPDLVASLVLLDTTAEPEPSKFKYKALNLIARHFGLGPVAKAVMPAFYGKTSLSDPARADDRAEWLRQLVANRRSVWRAVNGVLERESIHGELNMIVAPTLVAVGDEDVATVPALSERIAGAIRGAKLTVIHGAGHCSAVEQPEAVTLAISGFLGNLASQQQRNAAAA